MKVTWVLGLKKWSDSDNTADFMYDIGKELAKSLNSRFMSRVTKKDNAINTDGAEDVAMAAEYWMKKLDEIGGDGLKSILKPSMKKLASVLNAKINSRQKDKDKGEDVADASHLAAWKRMLAFAEKHS